ncbi:hypothetical protein [Deinococcus gobiensis]|uniref:Uncharacterized protein n=1 Tax=Deinococcus gobiensis (strain DSM 21396 / JCM 16679 / CGMCC 1.7299 / I-0) TaxID=745776 RepID=H8H275_DEIGI|nr:hypothetical protein [Deinococcus gobiensis]AFD27622.1 hypothetical protein DGo_PB0353 [Deinococcus gobiensis I-0]
MRLRLLLPAFVLAMATALLTFPEVPAPTAFWQLLTFAVSLTATPLLLVSILARLTRTEG